VKCNVDVMIFKDQGCYRIDVRLRGGREGGHGNEDNLVQRTPSNQRGETRGLKEAIKWLVTLRFTSLSIELECSEWLRTSLATSTPIPWLVLS
jgi:hypothetical protein